MDAPAVNWPISRCRTAPTAIGKGRDCRFRDLSGPKLWILLGLMFALQGHADEPGKVPYAAIYQVLQPGLIMDDYPRLRAVQRVESRMPGVEPATVRIWIDAAAGTIEVPIDQRGHARFPLTDALLAENPAVRSNQPQGSLNIQVALEARLPDQREIPYQQVWEAIEQAQSALDRLGGSYAGAEVQCIEYRFAGSDREFLVSADEYEQKLIADASGRLVIRADPRWLRDRVRLKVRGKLRSAVPRLR